MLRIKKLKQRIAEKEALLKSEQEKLAKAKVCLEEILLYLSKHMKSTGFNERAREWLNNSKSRITLQASIYSNKKTVTYKRKVCVTFLFKTLCLFQSHSKIVHNSVNSARRSIVGSLS